jgi:transcriptional regulator with XRE-family HTH domain
LNLLAAVLWPHIVDKMASQLRNRFGYLLEQLCAQRGITLKGLARAADIKGTSRIYYAIRPKVRGRRSTPLTERELERVAKALRLSVEGSKELYLSAEFEQAGTHLQTYIRELEGRILPQVDAPIPER